MFFLRPVEFTGALHRGAAQSSLSCATPCLAVLNSVLASKPLCAEANLASLVASAVSAVMPPNPKDFDTENVRVAKLQGGRLSQSTVVNGMVVTRPPNGERSKASWNGDAQWVPKEETGEARDS